ncbi:MAG: hypothetical protein QE271_10465 [Bacteriovoracaceae bacterium]|nr:hypothetical protein [Bacteriovoracaceae bacterium]
MPFNKNKLLKFIKNENFQFLFFLLVLMIVLFWRINRFYDGALEGTKMQILRKMK